MARSKKESPAPKSSVKKAPASPAKKEPGLLKQVAANAAGVAVGSAVGHVVGQKLMGGGGGEEKKTKTAEAVPCDFEWQQFVRCTRESKDVSACLPQMDAFKDCQKKHPL